MCVSLLLSEVLDLDKILVFVEIVKILMILRDEWFYFLIFQNKNFREIKSTFPKRFSIEDPIFPSLSL